MTVHNESYEPTKNSISAATTNRLPSKIEETPGTSISPVVYASFAPTELPQPEGFASIDDHIRQQEEDPFRRAALKEARKEMSGYLYPEGNSIASLRMGKGWSQHQLAEAMNTSQPQIARIESGRLDPQLSTLIKLSEALGVGIGGICQILGAEK